MIDLDVIQLRRAEEQMGADTWRYTDRGEVRPPGRGPNCDCGECVTCAKRERMRVYREQVKAGQRRKGRYSLKRTCRYTRRDGSICGERIADCNSSGLCSAHRRTVWTLQNYRAGA